MISRELPGCRGSATRPLRRGLARDPTPRCPSRPRPLRPSSHPAFPPLYPCLQPAPLATRPAIGTSPIVPDRATATPTVPGMARTGPTTAPGQAVGARLTAPGPSLARGMLLLTRTTVPLIRSDLLCSMSFGF